jgi:trk system potassium uptake protein TrkA
MTKKQYAVIGLGRFGQSVALTLSSLGHDVLVIDNNEHLVQEIAEDVTHAVQVDARDEAALKQLGIRNFDVVVVAISQDIESSILITVILKDLGVKMVVAKAQNQLHGKVLEKVGADKVVFPEKDMGVRLVHNLVSPNILDFIELHPDYSIMEVIAPKSFVNKTLGQLNLRAKYNLSVLAIKKEDTIVVAPGADAKIEANDAIILVGRSEVLEKLMNN